MCGIGGYSNGARATDAATLTAYGQAMADALAHRGPDDHGVHADPRWGLVLAHRRLAILDPSPAGHQPMRSPCGRWTLVYNGEIYNYRALAAELEAAGRPPRGGSDTAVLLEALATWGVERTLGRLEGMFAFALCDHHAGRLTLARDRLGIKPLYYGWHPCDAGSTATDGAPDFYFASELKALLAHPRFAARLDRRAVARYLALGYVPAPHCILRGMGKLPPGTWLEVPLDTPRGRDGGGEGGAPGDMPARPQAYWSASARLARALRDPFQGSLAEAEAECEGLLAAAVRKRMIADVPLGAFLSGGVDSSLVTAMMVALVGGPVRTFAIGFEEAMLDESGHARAVAAHLGTRHEERILGARDLLAMVPAMPGLYDEPFADSSQIPFHLLCRMTRPHVTVALSGDGGDELFAGYNRYALLPALYRRSRALPPAARRALATTLGWVPAGVWDALGRALHRIRPTRLSSRSPSASVRDLRAVLTARTMGEAYEALVCLWPEAEALVLGGAPPSPARPGLDGGAADVEGSGPVGLDPIRAMMHRDLIRYLPDDILVKVDRASMGVGLEARVPLLDHHLVEFAQRLPLSLLCHGVDGKWLLRRILYRHVPRALVDRPKQGFAGPVGAWLRGPLRGWMEDLLAPGRLRAQGLLDPAPIQRAMREHLAGRVNHTQPLWAAIMLQAWLDAYPRVERG